ncbi:hypothetical protein [Cedecea colo]|uniref:hypothetical protein n=1 Tax=Cedecea colo TaxID=2552946 RepID=UPI001F47B4EA|nr:hypothetical protein [Cedecea colo]
MNNVNKGWRNACVLTALPGVTLSTRIFAAVPAPDAAVSAVTAAPEVAAAPEATAESAAAPVRFLVMANQESPLSSVVAGRVARIYVKEGQGIGAGAQVIDLVSNGTRKARLNSHDINTSDSSAPETTINIISSF